MDKSYFPWTLVKLPDDEKMFVTSFFKYFFIVQVSSFAQIIMGLEAQIIMGLEYLFPD